MERGRYFQEGVNELKGDTGTFKFEIASNFVEIQKLVAHEGPGMEFPAKR